MKLLRMLNKTITSDFFTTISFKQALLSLLSITLRLPFLRKGNSNNLLENKLLEFLGLKNSKIISFYNGRSAIFHCLKSLKLNPTDEVIVNGYNCITVSNAVIQAGVKIKYSDIEYKTMSFDVNILKNNISKNTKVIILQHTFGFTAELYDDIISLARDKNIIIIEDCAHSLGINTGYKCDFAIYSTGRDKVISSITGGFLIINNKKYFNIIEGIKLNLKLPSLMLVIKNHIYNLNAYKAYILYDIANIGKIIMYVSMKFGLITKILTNSEKECNFKDFNFSLPNSLAYLGINELYNIKKYISHRKNLGDLYVKNINNSLIGLIFDSKVDYNYFRLPILLKNNLEKDRLYNYMRNNKIILGKSWSGINIAPLGSDLNKAKYTVGECSVAENISDRILTLPNHYLLNKNDIDRVIKIINNFK